MANTSGAGSLGELFKTFGPALFGSGTTTTSSTADPAALAASRGITTQALANADNAEGATNDIVNRIIQKNAIAFGPVASGARTAGLYNDSVLKQLSSEAQASSTAEASKAVLDFQTQQLGIAQRSTADQLSATRTQTSRTAPQVPTSLSSLLGVGLGGISAYKNRSDVLDFFGIGKKADASTNAPLTDAGTGGVARDAGDSLNPGASQTQTNAAFGDTSASTQASSSVGPQELGTNLDTQAVANGESAVPTEFAAPVAEDGGGADAATTAQTGSDALTGADATPTADALATTSDAADGALVDAGTGELAADAGTSIAEAGAEDAAVELGTDVAVDGAAEAIGVAAAPETFGLSLIAVPILQAIFGDSSIICAELKRQGKLSDSLARRSLMHFRKYKEVSREAYYIWAKPSVRHLRETPDSYYSKTLAYVFNYRSTHLVAPTILTAGAYYLVSTVTVACWPLLKLRNFVDSYKMNSYLKNLYRSF